MNRAATSVAAVCVGSLAHAGAVLLGPDPYLSLADCPFLGLDGLFVEDFETGALSVPGVVASTGFVVGPGGNTDSVDADDGAIDGSGTNGRSWYSANGSAGILFTFDADVLGTLPARAGIVWTDGAGEISFEAFDADGHSLGTLTGTHAGIGHYGQTDEDRFYGVEHAGGVGSILIRNSSGGIEVDHLQFVVPAAPTAAPLLALLAIHGRTRR